MTQQRLKTQVLVIGAGISGSTSALPQKLMNLQCPFPALRFTPIVGVNAGYCLPCAVHAAQNMRYGLTTDKTMQKI